MALLVDLAVAPVHPHQLVVGQLKHIQNKAFLTGFALTFKRDNENENVLEKIPVTHLILWYKHLREASGNATAIDDKEVEPEVSIEIRNCDKYFKSNSNLEHHLVHTTFLTSFSCHENIFVLMQKS